MYRNFYGSCEVIKDNAICGLQSAIEISGALVHLRKEHAKAILELLKEHEPVEPWLSYDGNEYIFHCSNCDYEIYHNGDSRDEYKAKEYAIFCRHCGRKVKWE